MHDRKEYMEQNVEKFDCEYINIFDKHFENIMSEAIEENLSKPKTHYDSTEVALTNRILEYKANYFLWMHNFTLPYDDNLSERALRGVKSKMKIAGQFQNIQYAKYYADIKFASHWRIISIGFSHINPFRTRLKNKEKGVQ